MSEECMPKYGIWLATAPEMFENEVGVWGSSVYHANGARTGKKTRPISLWYLDHVALYTVPAQNSHMTAGEADLGQLCDALQKFLHVVYQFFQL